MNSSSTVYDCFAPFIREYIYREKWKLLHSIQEKAAVEIFNGKDHVLIAAGTAGGKTEAAFFPVLSILEPLFRKGKKPLVLYISPLKALINDQARRLERLLCSESGSGQTIFPLWRWHGDIDSGSKNRFVENPCGVLLITPESLEALLLRRPQELGHIFNELLFVVIDEVHVFMGSDRGSQLICHFSRIQKAKTDYLIHHTDSDALYSRSDFRRIGLSATLGDYDGGRNWLSQGSEYDTALVEDNAGTGKHLSLLLNYHAVQSAHNKGTEFYRSLYEETKNKRAIIFTNSRLEAEECAASLSTLALSLGEPDIFQIHHGSVSALLRDEAEEQLKSGEGPQVICATATLELGIDIGDLDRIIQLGPPWSVSAFVHRLGRSGRRSGRAEMYFGITGFPSAKGNPSLPWELLRTIAVIQLYLEEKWIEPPSEKPLPYSLLIHQILAILASQGEHSLEKLAAFILSFPPFSEITLEDFRTLVAWLEKCGCIGTTEEGTLILGLEGEHIVNRYSFYPVFPGEESFRVIFEGREIGVANFVPDPLSVLIVGGQRWTVKNIIGIKREIWVTETEDEGNERLWRGRGGGTHNRIIEKIRQILLKIQEIPDEAIKTLFPYLSTGACIALTAGAHTAKRLGITDEPLFLEEDCSDTKKSPITVLLFPWTGSVSMRTIAAVLENEKNKKLLRIIFINQEEDLYFRIETNLTLCEFRTSIIEVFQKASIISLEEICPKELPYTDKFDYLLPPKLLAKQYAANMLDKTTLEKLLKMLK